MSTTVAAPTRPLTERSALDLARAIREGEVTSREIVEAHVARLREVQPRINAVAADRFEAALEDADAADRRVAEASDPDELPPLLGVPCTIKESIALAGMPNCAGLISRREHRATETAPAAARVLEAGAIPLAVTNVSELTMWIESQNFVYGRTNNAYDPSRVAGGSSGGEGAAVGSGGSPIGLGTDIGGSIRLPAFFNGVFGHKCSAWIVPNSGHFPAAEGEVTRMLSLGPLTRRAEDLMPLLRIVAGPDGIDPYTREVELGDPADVVARRPAGRAGRGHVVRPGTPRAARRARAGRRRARRRRGQLAPRVAALDAPGARLLPRRRCARARTRECATCSRRRREEAARLTLGRAGWGALRGRGPHTIAMVILLATEALAARTPERLTKRALAAGKALAREVEDVIGDGVLLHPPHPRVAPQARAYRRAPAG